MTAAPGLIAPPRSSPLRRAWLRRRAGVTLGDGVRIGRGVKLRAEDGGRIKVADGVVLGDGVRLHSRGGAIEVGAGAAIGDRSVIVCHDEVTIGARVLLGARVAILDFAPVDADPERPVRLQGITAAPVRVGDGAAIGHQAALLRGAKVAAGASVRPGTVVPRPRTLRK